MENRCPSCQRVVLQRRLAKCEFCGVSLPEALRLNDAEIEDARERELAVLERQRERRKQDEEDEQRRRGSDGAGGVFSAT